MAQQTLTIALVGSGGAGVAVTGEMLLRAAGKQGYYGFLRKAFGPQIRGGESAAILRLGNASIGSFKPTVDVLLALDWENFSRFEDEISITGTTLVFADELAGDPPPIITATTNVINLPLSSIAQTHQSDRPNMVALGFLGRMLSINSDFLEAALLGRLVKKSEEIRLLASCSVQSGYGYEGADSATKTLLLPELAEGKERWMLSGNQAVGYGALQAGLKFVSAYPITPASDVLEWLAKPIEKIGGHLVQAEDELAAINMAIGASYGGVPSLTATSGPGLSLMSEAMGLAVASETPLVIVNVQRGGPSTGIPTKSEQSDLNLAIYGLHGDAPHVVLAPLDIEDCIAVGALSLQVAEHLQTLVIVLSDQFIGQSLTVIDPPAGAYEKAQRVMATDQKEGNYQRYTLNESGVSPMAFPGQEGLFYTADGLEHNTRGIPSPKASDHKAQLEKRRHKIEQYNFGHHWARVTGEGEVAILCWGSLAAAAEEAIREFKSLTHTKVIALRQLSPFPKTAMKEALVGVNTLIIVEQNQSGQFYHYFKSQMDFSGTLASFATPGPLPINAFDIAQFLEGVTA